MTQNLILLIVEEVKLHVVLGEKKNTQLVMCHVDIALTLCRCLS